LSNGHSFHVAALLLRGKTLVKIGTNGYKSHPIARRCYPKSEMETFDLHAEMSILHCARPDDVLIVLRFQKSGQLSCARPCPLCSRLIQKSGLSRVYYSDWNGVLTELID
jgi:deoxycytidylate deaminase